MKSGVLARKEVIQQEGGGGGKGLIEDEYPRNNKAPAFLQGLRLIWCGTRRTVRFGEARFSGRLDCGGKFDVPQLVTINKSASYGVRWNRIRDFLDVSTLSVGK
jgi:hypothetical protein